MTGVRDWSDHSPDAEPCWLVVTPPDTLHPAGLLGAVHARRDVAEIHAGNIGGLVVELPYFADIPQVREQ